MRIFNRELRRNLKAFLVWTISMSLFIAMIIAFYPSIADNAVDYAKMLDQLPKAMLSAFNLDTLSLADPLGFYGAEAYVLVLLFASVYAVQLGAGILSKEEDERTIEFLLAKPISRAQIVWEKIWSVLFYLTLFNVVTSGVTYVGLEMVKREAYNRAALFYLFLGAYVVQMVFAALGLLISVFVTKAKSILPLSIGIVLGSYIISVMAKMSARVEFFKYLTPFSYADAGEIINTGTPQIGYMVLSLALIMAAVLGTFYFYERKDITA